MHRKYTAAITSNFCNKASTSASMQREEASTHKSAKTHAGTILWLVTLAFNLFTSKYMQDGLDLDRVVA